jgi:hypothetical protein
MNKKIKMITIFISIEKKENGHYSGLYKKCRINNLFRKRKMKIFIQKKRKREKEKEKKRKQEQKQEQEENLCLVHLISTFSLCIWRLDLIGAVKSRFRKNVKDW